MSAPVSNPNSNTFRAEPFVNLTAESVSNGTGAAASGSNSRRASQIFSTADPVEFREMMVQDEQDELIDDDDDEELDENGMSRRGSSTSRIRTRLPNHNNGGRLSISSGPHVHAASSISDLQRASIASTTSSTSSARRSSYDPNEPGVLEKIHTGQGKSKRKPISVHQWKHMNTFKIRPPTAAEAASSSATNTSVATPISVDPFQQYSPPLSGTPDRKVESEAGFVFIPEGHSANAVPAAPPIPRTVPIVMPPTTINQAPNSASLTKPVRKRARLVFGHYPGRLTRLTICTGERNQMTRTFKFSITMMLRLYLLSRGQNPLTHLRPLHILIILPWTPSFLHQIPMHPPKWQ